MSLHNMLHLRVREQSICPSLSLILLLVEFHDHSLSQSALNMALQVYILYTFMQKFIISSHTQWLLVNIYGAVTNQIITFAEGQMRATHTIIINQDDDCEYDPNENFFSNISLNSDKQPISVIRPCAEVIIDDTNEPECRKCQTHTIMSYTCYSCIVHAHITKYSST